MGHVVWYDRAGRPLAKLQPGRLASPALVADDDDAAPPDDGPLAVAHDSDGGLGALDDDQAFAPPPDDDDQQAFALPGDSDAPPADEDSDDGDDVRPATTWEKHDRRAARKARKAERSARRARKAERCAARQRERDTRVAVAPAPAVVATAPAAATAPADQLAALDAFVDTARDRAPVVPRRVPRPRPGRRAPLRQHRRAPERPARRVLRRRPPALALGCARCRHAAGGCLACRPAGVLPPGVARIGDAPPVAAALLEPACRASRGAHVKHTCVGRRPAATGGRAPAAQNRGRRRGSNRGRAKRARSAPEPNWDDIPDAGGGAPSSSRKAPRPRPRRRCVRTPLKNRDADAAFGHAIALSYAQGPEAWGANDVIFPDGQRFSKMEADPLKLTYY